MQLLSQSISLTLLFQELFDRCKVNESLVWVESAIILQVALILAAGAGALESPLGCGCLTLSDCQGEVAVANCDLVELVDVLDSLDKHHT